MRKRLFVGVLLLISTQLLPSEGSNKPVVSVLDFEVSGLAESEARVFVDYISSSIAKTGAYLVIGRRQRETLPDETEFSYRDCADETCQIEVGKLLAATHVVVGVP